MKNTLSLLLLFASLIACKTAHETSPSATGDTRLVALQLHGCRGFCPQYILTFHNTGRLEYEGIRNVAQSRTATFQLTADELKRLQNAVKATNVWQYPERIESPVADAPMSSITVFAKDKTKTVMGSVGRPKPLVELEKLMQELATAHGLKLKAEDAVEKMEDGN